MIQRYEIERAVEAFVSGPDIDYEEVRKKYKHDGFILETIAMRLNSLKHKYLRALVEGNNSEEVFERICNIMPGFLLMRE